ncbi:siderochrome-iron transporter [Fusarium beomiforme]|uniref:Siderochrome-iron transporter n=1 Tax=Fusarium beomiforme TaxID=44412 RepID=A0A9P5DWI0_9HYPO|nr:siderochrome-iron transporter [Fusarium beomiforme]
MGFLEKIRGQKHAAVPSPNHADETIEDTNRPAKGGALSSGTSDDSLDLVDRNEQEVLANGTHVTADAQIGIQKAEAVALVWSKKTVYITYAWIWVCFFMLAFQQSILNNVTYYAYSDFQQAPQIATAQILSSIIGGVLKLPIAKVLNIWGRAEGFVVFVIVYLVGMIILASSNGPDSYAAGYVLYYIGYSAVYFIMDVFIADTSGLRNRAFAFAFVSTPFICTAFTGPLGAQSFIKVSSWRWAIGTFCIVMAVVLFPLAIVFKFFQRKAEKMGLFVKTPSGRTVTQSIVYYFHEFDIVGAFILMAAFVLFLLPFSLTSYGRSTYSSATFIAMVIIGFIMFFVFAAWEKYGARKYFIRWELLKNRTVLGACLLAAILWFSFYSWDQYFYYYVQVVYNLDISKTGYMVQIYNVGSCFWGVVFGVYIRYTKHFKYACLFFGLPLMFLGAGLMIHFRGQDKDIGYVIMCQIFIAISGGTLVIGEDMAVMASADRDGVPLMLAMLNLFASLGGAIGYAVANAIYTNTFPEALQGRLPQEALADWSKIYLGGSQTQLLYPPGTPTRDAINYAWGYSQKYNCISATAILVLAIPCIAMWKNYNVDKAQNKGMVI